MCLPCVIGLAIGFCAGITLAFYCKTRILGCVLILACAVISGRAIYQTQRYEHYYKSIEVGTRKEKVRDLLGSPDSVTDGTKAEYGFSRSKNDIREDVTEEFWYYCMYAPEIWFVSFGKDGTVISKGHMISP